LNALQKLDLRRCSNLKNYLHLLTNWKHSKSWICKGVLIWKNYLHLLVNWMHFRSLFIKFLELEGIVKKYIHL
jgi:hypothetical protein